MDLDYPDAEEDLNRWLPLVKWLLLAVPQLVVLVFLGIGAFFPVVIACFESSSPTGRYPSDLFDYVVGVGLRALGVTAYATLLVTDRYPPSGSAYPRPRTAQPPPDRVRRRRLDACRRRPLMALKARVRRRNAARPRPTNSRPSPHPPHSPSVGSGSRGVTAGIVALRPGQV